MIEKSEEKKYEPYDDSYFTMTREQLDRLEYLSLWYGFPYEAPFFGMRLVDGKTNPLAKTQKKEWEEKHGPMPPITIIENPQSPSHKEG